MCLTAPVIIYGDFYSTYHPNMLSMDGQRRRHAMKDWSTTCHRLLGVLQRSAIKALGQEEGSLLLRTGRVLVLSTV